MRIPHLFTFLLILISFKIFGQNVIWNQNAHPSTNSVTGIGFNTNGSKIVSGTECHPAYIRQYNTSDGVITWDYNVGNTLECIMGISFSANSSILAAVEERGRILVFDNATSPPTLLTTIGAGSGVYAIAFAISPDNSTLGIGLSNGKVKTYRIPTGSFIREYNMNNSLISALSFSRNGSKIIAGGDNGKIIIVDTAGTNLTSQNGHTGDVTSLAIDNSDTILISSSSDKSIKIWSINGNNLNQSKVINGHRFSVSSISLSPNNSKFVSGSADKFCKIWDAKTGNLLSQFAHIDSGAVNSVSWSPNGDTIAVAYGNGKIALWKAEFNSVGIDEQSTFHSFEIFPTEVKSELKISSIAPLTFVSIHNTQGVEIFNTFVNSKTDFTVNVENINSGIYFATIKNENGISVSKRFVKIN
jgi:WD40 repeat protein